jgi:hypothetical protein
MFRRFYLHCDLFVPILVNIPASNRVYTDVGTRELLPIR